jgi:hypothetical protein
MLKHCLCWIFVRSVSFETLFEFCQLPDVGIGVDCFFCWHHIHKNHWHHLCWLKDGAALIRLWYFNFHEQWHQHISALQEWSIGASVEGSTSINIEKMFVDVSVMLSNKELYNGTLWQHASLAGSFFRCCCRDAVKSLYNFVCKCQKFDISLI